LRYPRQGRGVLCSRRAQPSSSGRVACATLVVKGAAASIRGVRGPRDVCEMTEQAGRAVISAMLASSLPVWRSAVRRTGRAATSSRWLSDTAPTIARSDRWIRHRAKAMPRRRHWSDPPLSCHVSSARAVLGRRYSRRQGAAALIRGARDSRRQGRVACATLVVKGAASSVHGARSPRRVCEMTGQAGPAVISVMLASSLPIWRSAVRRTGRAATGRRDG
jgi:hypothetical protein